MFYKYYRPACVLIVLIVNECATQGFFPTQKPVNCEYLYEPIVQTVTSWGGFQVQGKPILWNCDGFARRYYLNMFLGVPYATPPIRDLRFKNPERPKGWTDNQGKAHNYIWDSTYYRPACPQTDKHLKSTLAGKVNISENCLYMNIFVPNITLPAYVNRKYPVMVFFHGGEYQYGSSQEWPGYELAKKNVMVVTVNYRLGPFGFLSTEDEHSRGNYGLMDQKMALEYIRDNIEMFGGDKTKVTIFGEDAGAASVGLHLVSPLMRNSDLYQRAMTMSGSDLCEWAVISPTDQPKEYAYELGRKVGCQVIDHSRLLDCLRRHRTMDEIIAAGSNVTRKPWLHSGPWAPVVDGPNGFLPELPKQLRDKGQMSQVQYMSGVTKDEGAWIVQNKHKTKLTDQAKLGGMTPRQFKISIDEFLKEQVAKHFYERGHVYRSLTAGIHPDNYDLVQRALTFEYTYWVNKDNDTARAQMLIDLYSDKLYGTGVDAALKYHVKYNRTYSYVFGYRSVISPLPKWMGVPHGGVNPYIFGLPFLNQSMRAKFSLKHSIQYDLRDRNISEFMMDMWSNFSTRGNATPNGVQCYNYPESFYRLPDGVQPFKLDETQRRVLQERYPNHRWLWDNDPNSPAVTRPWQCNISWPVYNSLNLTYLNIENVTYEKYNYRQDHYAFWREFYPSLVHRIPMTSTPWPTPQLLTNYQTSTYTMAVLVFIGFIIIGALSITLCRRIS